MTGPDRTSVERGVLAALLALAVLRAASAFEPAMWAWGALAMWAIARTYPGDHRGAESLYVALAERTPDDPLVWVGLGGAAQRVGDRVQSARALARLNAYAPQGREARLIRRHLQIFPEVWPPARRDVGGEAGGTRR